MLSDCDHFLNQTVKILREIGGKAFVLMDSQGFTTSQRQTRATPCEPLRITPVWRDPGLSGQFVNLFFHVIRDQLQLRGDATV